jgi:peptide/nickel transport system permease protein
MQSSFIKYLGLRLTGALLAVIGAVALLLSLTLLIPGDPATVLLGPRATPEAVAALNAQMGLDLPLAERVVSFFIHLAQADLGRDILTSRPVTDIILDALPNTLVLAISSMLLAIIVGVPLGAASAIRPGGIVDQIIAFFSIGFVSAPSFVISIFLLLVFAVRLDWFPVLGVGQGLIDQAWHLVLPAIAIAVGWIGYVARLLRSSLLEVLGEQYIRTMRAYGVPEYLILLKYALKPACIPTLAILGMGIGELMSRAVFAEVIFNRPGLGSLIYQSISTRNYPTAQGAVFTVVLLFVVTNLLVDLSYAWIDPRGKTRSLVKSERPEA